MLPAGEQCQLTRWKINDLAEMTRETPRWGLKADAETTCFQRVALGLRYIALIASGLEAR